MTSDHDQELAALVRRFPRWEAWKGVSGLFYAPWLRSSPPVVVRGESPEDLADQIDRAQRLAEGRRPS
jgi:hypothetical protein